MIFKIRRFRDEEEVIERANNSRYGLAATIWTTDISRAHRVARRIHSGYIWVNSFMIRDLNMPFGGFKESGTGREGYPYSFDFFTEKKTVCVYYG
jgi:acyl-CoA reductase-like NAD-dependent aldehyde dehydrogenase